MVRSPTGRASTKAPVSSTERSRSASWAGPSMKLVLDYAPGEGCIEVRSSPSTRSQRAASRPPAPDRTSRCWSGRIPTGCRPSRRCRSMTGTAVPWRSMGAEKVGHGEPDHVRRRRRERSGHQSSDGSLDPASSSSRRAPLARSNPAPTASISRRAVARSPEDAAA